MTEFEDWGLNLEIFTLVSKSARRTEVQSVGEGASFLYVRHTFSLKLKNQFKIYIILQAI